MRNGKSLPGFSRYLFYLDQNDQVVIKNKATSFSVSPLDTVSEICFSLTNDKGKRETVSGEKVRSLLCYKEEQVSKKLSEEQIESIKEMLRNGVAQKQISSLFKVHQSTISDIKRGIIHKK